MEDTTDTTPETTEGAPDGADETAADETGSKANREARYRTERNAAREELATASARILALQTREVERLAGDLAEPKDLLTLSGKELGDLLNEDGDVDAEAVAEAVADVLAARPGLRKNDAAIDPSQGLGGGRPKAQPTWGSLLTP
jgi:hypothetical protein